MSESSVPVPRPSEPLEIKSCPWCGVEPVSQFLHGSRYNIYCEYGGCPINPEMTADTRDEAIERWNRRPSVPTATQDDSIRGRAFIAGFMAGYDQRAVGGVEPHELVRARAEEKANRYVAAYKPAKLDKPITPAVASSEEAANSDTPQIDKLRETLCRWSMQGRTDDFETPIVDDYGKRILSMVLRELPAARVQGENSQ